MTTAFYGNTATPSGITGILDGDDDFMRYIDIVRFIAWLLEIIRKLREKMRKKPEQVVAPTPTSLSCDEFGYIDWNGAY